MGGNGKETSDPAVFLPYLHLTYPDGQTNGEANWLNNQDDADLRGASGGRRHRKGV